MIRFPFGALGRPVALAMCLSFTASASAAPPIIDDQEIIESLSQQLGDFVGKEGVPSAEDLAKTAGPGLLLKPNVAISGPSVSPGNDYETLSRSVYLIGTVYQCDKCEHWHQGGTATAWCISPDGLMVTNAHVFRDAKGGAMGVIDLEKHCFPVTQLLGYDTAADIAIFRVKGENLPALRLAATSKVGDPVTVISNPEHHHFIRTEGAVARYVRHSMGKNLPKVTWMSITADYAKGSSGGPVFNAAGDVSGMVSTTQSIYTGSGPRGGKNSPSGELQMVVHDCVPVDSIRALLEPEKPQAGN